MTLFNSAWSRGRTLGNPVTWRRLALVGVALAAACAGPAAIVFDGSAYPDPSGETRALVLWARFADDSLPIEYPVTAAHRGWVEPDRLPPLAADILSGSTSPTGLTEYFLTQSAGKFRLTGRSFPEVLVTQAPEANYRSPDGTLDQEALTHELLEMVDADPRVDLEDFDADRDGFVDYLFIVMRGVRNTRLYPTHASGVSDLGYTSAGPELGSQSRLRVDRDASGSYVRYNTAGNIFPEIDLVRLMAHEIGHDLWRDFVHLRPVLPAPGIPPFAERQVGYVLMSGGSDARGDETISAYERDLLGWITCHPLTRDTTVVIRDLYTGDQATCFTYDVPRLNQRAGTRRIYLSHRRRIGIYDRLYIESAEVARSEQGLMDTGLLVMATEEDGRVGPVPADGALKLSTRAHDYEGDLFRPGSRLTPWTSPNSTGYLTFSPTGLGPASPQPDDLFQGLHIVASRGNDVMEITYIADERNNARFRDGDVIPVIPGLQFMGPASAEGRVRVLGSATFHDSLIVKPDAHLILSGSLVVQRLILLSGSTLEVQGVLRLQDLTREAGTTVMLNDSARVLGAGSQALKAAATRD